MNLPTDLLNGVRADALALDWDAVAATVAADIAEGRAFIPTSAVGRFFRQNLAKKPSDCGVFCAQHCMKTSNVVTKLMLISI